jgi:hypothetical protein
MRIRSRILIQLKILMRILIQIQIMGGCEGVGKPKCASPLANKTGGRRSRIGKKRSRSMLRRTG